jgi:hypothetical protein
MWINYSHWIKYTTLYLAVCDFSLHLLKNRPFSCANQYCPAGPIQIFSSNCHSNKYENESKKTILIPDVESGCPFWDSW